MMRPEIQPSGCRDDRSNRADPLAPTIEPWVTAPADLSAWEDFRRTRAHPSNLYYGASLAALCRLAAAKGYRLVGCTSAGVNVFFVRQDLAGSFPPLTPAEGYVESRFRESRDRSGAPSS